MKAVMLSIKPKYCELIASGKKTIEVRKTRPNIATPFKCYIYCTKGKLALLRDDKDESERYKFEHYPRVTFHEQCGRMLLNGKVIGEFVCDRITSGYLISPWGDYIQKETALTYAEIEKYAGNKPVCSWHISDLVIYDKPKKLREFWHCGVKLGAKVSRPPQSWCYVEEV